MSESKQDEQAAASAGSSSDLKENDARDNNKAASPPPEFQPNGRFWAIIVTCSVISLLSALENTVITTALPHIVTELELGENYVWVTNVFFLTG